MCIKIDVLLSIIQVVRVWCGILVSATGHINNGGMLKCSVAGIQNTTMQTGEWNMVTEVIQNCTAEYNMLHCSIGYRKATESHTVNTSLVMMTKCLMAYYFSSTKCRC